MAVPKLKAPIVLVHGLLGFNQVKLCGYTLARYFPDIPEFLALAGNHVLVAGLSPTAGVVQRAGQLKRFLDQELPGAPVHLLAHSMGGLDSRYLISRLNMADRVLTLTTIGTPHRGSRCADWGIRRLARLLAPVLDLVDFPYQAFYDLTTERCRAFNEQVPDSAKVRYFSVAGRFPENGWYSRMQMLHQFVQQTEGPNDGVVSLASASYGECCEIWQGDHLSLVNWPEPGERWRGLSTDRKPDYARLLGRLRDEGF